MTSEEVPFPMMDRVWNKISLFQASQLQQGGEGGCWGAPGGGRGGSRPPLPKSEAPFGAEEGVEEGQQVLINSRDNTAPLETSQ